MIIVAWTILIRKGKCENSDQYMLLPPEIIESFIYYKVTVVLENKKRSTIMNDTNCIFQIRSNSSLPICSCYKVILTFFLYSHEVYTSFWWTWMGFCNWSNRDSVRGIIWCLKVDHKNTRRFYFALLRATKLWGSPSSLWRSPCGDELWAYSSSGAPSW